jgi:PAS domain S-box-containing protein
MQRLDGAVAMAIFARDNLAGVMLLGPRRSGRIYGSVEQNALQVLCGQLAVAVENAQLFTEVQNAKIYNETLLQNLTTGVIAASADGTITVFNKEAEQITGLPWRNVLDRSISELPPVLRQVLDETLRTGEPQTNRETILRSGDEGVIARISSSIFHGQEEQMLGALMVLTDITALKRLEQQIRRSDRLASLGTLSAGMAHEIKNPLVSIKTFTQLPAERYPGLRFRGDVLELDRPRDRPHRFARESSCSRFARPGEAAPAADARARRARESRSCSSATGFIRKRIKLSRSWNAELIRSALMQISSSKCFSISS